MTQPSDVISASPIAPDEIQYLSYRNGFIQGRCRSKECVMVSRLGFASSVSAKTWDSRELFERPHAARLLSGDEATHAATFFERPQADIAAHGLRRPRGP